MTTDATDDLLDTEGVSAPTIADLPFLDPILTRPDRVAEVIRRNKQGQPTGVTARLMCEVTIPLVGRHGARGALSIKTGIWRDSRFSREDRAFVDTYSVSLSRNQFELATGARAIYDEWRQGILDLYDEWSKQFAHLPEAVRESGPRLVKTRGVKTEPTSLDPTPIPTTV